MKPAPFAKAIAFIVLQHILQQARGFSFGIGTTHSFHPQAWRLLTTTTTKISPVISRLRHAIQTSSTCRPQSHLLSSTPNEVGKSSATPITVLSGFLGSGKTTLMQHMLTNNEGLKIAVIVNDVASVNIDSKLVRGRTATAPGTDGDGDEDAFDATESAPPAGIVELQNGCACCSTSGELLTSVSELMTLSDMRQEDEKFDHIVIEMSGVAEPRSVRNIFQEAMMYDMPLMERVSLDTLVTVVDCSTYLDYLGSSRLANVAEAPELFYRNGEEKEIEDGGGGDGWMSGMQSNMLDGEGGYEGGVCDLLVEQTEVADVVLLNKIDIVQGKLEDTKQLVTTLNPRAKIISTSFGKVQHLSEIMGVTKGEGVALDGVVDDHKDFVSAADAQNCSEPDCTNPLHSHDHSHSHDDPSADEQLDDAAGCAEPGCEDTSHSHAHSHSSDTATHDEVDCTGQDCNDTSHSHSHGHSSDTAATTDCTDPGCEDTSHSHSHSHSSDTTTHAGIGTFVYRARRPFHPRRLLSILQKLPVVRGVPVEESGDEVNMDESATKVFQQILRSKGFAWTADSNVKALYWSHAGSSFEMQCLGRWWSTLPQQQWPEEAKDSILADYDSMDHDETSASTTTSTVGDRRQEIVFIGPGIGSLDSQAVLKSTIDSCLLNDEEWDIFRSKRDDEASLSYFENSLQTRMLTY